MSDEKLSEARRRIALVVETMRDLEPIRSEKFLRDIDFIMGQTATLESSLARAEGEVESWKILATRAQERAEAAERERDKWKKRLDESQDVFIKRADEVTRAQLAEKRAIRERDEAREGLMGIARALGWSAQRAWEASTMAEEIARLRAESDSHSRNHDTALDQRDEARAALRAAALQAFRRWYVWAVSIDGPGEDNDSAFLERLEDETQRALRASEGEGA